MSPWFRSACPRRVEPAGRTGIRVRMAGWVVGVAVGSVVAVGAARAQQPDAWDTRDPSLTRAQLEQRLVRYDAAARSPAYSEGLRARARAGAAAIRGRLQDGDVHVGDRLRVEVEGQTLPTDTFTVTAGPALILPGVGRIALAGVLHSELQAQISGSVDRVFRGVTVRVRPLTRIVVVGGVVRPGFYALPADALVEDAIAAAGGLAPDAKLTGARVDRGNAPLVRPDSLQTAIQRRFTIGDLRLQDGDRFTVPVVVRRDSEATVRTLSYLLSIPLSLYTVVQLIRTL
jgi:protein involved in polysaccharide export with SLBB domain